jgi:hypothetical protein
VCCGSEESVADALISSKNGECIALEAQQQRLNSKKYVTPNLVPSEKRSNQRQSYPSQ